MAIVNGTYTPIDGYYIPTYYKDVNGLVMTLRVSNKDWIVMPMKYVIYRRYMFGCLYG